MKRIFSLLLCLIVSISFFSFNSYAEALSETSVELNVAVELGLLPNSALSRGEEVITRGEFLDALMTLMGAEASGIPVPLTDLSLQSPYYDSICAAYSLGYVNGYSDGTFRENEPMTKGDAVRLLVYVVGFKDLIESGMAVSTAARRADICNFAETHTYPAITVNEAAELLINTADARAVDIDSISQDGADYHFREETVLEKYRGIHKITGVIDGNRFTYLNEKSETQEGWIKIDELFLDAGETNAEELLGYNTSVYYSGGENVNGGLILSAHPYRNKAIDISAKDIVGYSNGELKYENEKGKIVSVKFNLANVDVIYNNRIDVSPKKENFEMEKGTVSVIDNNDDGTYDVVKILAYKTFIVDTVNKKDGRVYGKWGLGAVDFEAYDRVLFVSEIGGKMDVMELAEWDVLMVAESKDAFALTVLYTVGVIEGELSDYEIGEESFLYVNSTPYQASKFFVDNQLHELKKGTQGLYYLDNEGCIAAANFNSNKGHSFGYLMALAPISQFSGDIEVKLMNEKSEKIVTKFAERVVLNGKSVNIKKDEARTALLSLMPGVVIYGLDSNGLVNYIDIPYKENDGEISGLAASENYRNSLCLYYDGISEGTILQYRYNPKVFGGKIAASTNTLFFEIPKDTDKAEDDDYWVYDISYIEENAKKSIQAYRTNSDSLTAEVILFHKEDVAIDSVPTARAVSVIDRVKRTTDEDGNAVYLLRVFTGKQQREYLTLSDAIVDGYTLDGESYSLGSGDVVQLTVDIRGKISNCKLLYSRAKDNMNGANPSTSSFLSNLRVQRAFVFQKYKNNILTTTTPLVSGNQYRQSELEYLEMRNLDNYAILRYDSEEKCVTVCGQNDLIAHINSGNSESSKVVIYDKDGDGKTMIIYE